MSTSDKNSPPLRTGPRVFISYRRRSDQVVARLLRFELEKEFGEDSVFTDVEDIEPGEVFAQRIESAIKSCNVFLALVSPGWLAVAESLHNPEDFVRREIAAALANDGVRMIPILIGGAQMPRQEELPADIKELVSRQAEELGDSRHWGDDIRRLINAIRPPSVKPTPTRTFSFPGFFRTWWGKAALAALLLLMGLAVWLVAFAPSINTNGNVNAATPTPATTQTPDATRTPMTTPTLSTTPMPLAKCLRDLMPEGRWISINYGDPDERVIIRKEQSKGGPAGILLTRGVQEVGAIRFHFVRWGKDEAGSDSGYYEIEQAVGADCRPVEGFSPPPGGDVIGHRNYDWLDLPLGGRHYDLRIAYGNDNIHAYFSPKPN